MLLMHLFLKILSGMANSVDPDQTAPSGAVWSGSALFAYVILSETLVFEILGHLPYILNLFAYVYCPTKKKNIHTYQANEWWATMA